MSWTRLGAIETATNEQISSKVHAKYRHEHSSEGFEPQMINFDVWCDGALSDESFLDARRVVLANALNEFHGISTNIEDPG